MSLYSGSILLISQTNELPGQVSIKFFFIPVKYLTEELDGSSRGEAELKNRPKIFKLWHPTKKDER